MRVFMDTYLNLLKCSEYAPHLLKRPGEDAVYVNFEAMPKSFYLPLNGNYVEGLIFSQKLNEAKKDNGLVKVEPVKEISR